ncbi:MAG TPA: matrixin family metalloprotease, partial [Phycisphaerales bacterium]|nr:matrixin family metalloprotease [Phycisphaerales bacterium]
DVRVYNNFADPASNNNTTMDPMLPGYDGAELAIWKAGVEWGSLAHGDGSGDPIQHLGDGGANFDITWQGNASGVGNTDNNIVSATTGCSSGVVAFTELPTSNGWRIRFCDGQWNFADGPGGIGSGAFDIQGIQTHEYGHALGLGHSSDSAATMAPSSSPGQTKLRSINADDQAGVQSIYGVISSTKPAICETSVSGGSITIRGSNFDPVDNDVWFTNASTTSTGTDPRVRVFGVPSTGNGTLITVAIPAGAGPGDVLVKTSAGGAASLSNAFPTDLVGTITANGTCPLTVSSITPSEIEALIPGTAETVTISGTGFLEVTAIKLNIFTTVSSSRWTIQDDSTITMDMPQTGFLGANSFTLETPTDSVSIGFTIVEPATPKFELGNGDPLNTVANGTNMNLIVGGTVGTVHNVYYSVSNIPSNHALVDLDIGNMFTQLILARAIVIGSGGYTQMSFPITYSGSPMVFYSQTIDVTTPPNPKFAVSNLQSITMVQ